MYQGVRKYMCRKKKVGRTEYCQDGRREATESFFYILKCRNGPNKKFLSHALNAKQLQILLKILPEILFWKVGLVFDVKII